MQKGNGVRQLAKIFFITSWLPKAIQLTTSVCLEFSQLARLWNSACRLSKSVRIFYPYVSSIFHVWEDNVTFSNNGLFFFSVKLIFSLIRFYIVNTVYSFMVCTFYPQLRLNKKVFGFVEQCSAVFNRQCNANCSSNVNIFFVNSEQLFLWEYNTKP